MHGTEALAQFNTQTVIPIISHLAELHKLPGGKDFQLCGCGLTSVLSISTTHLLFLFADFF